MQQFIEWLQANDQIFAALGVLSVVLFLASLIVFPLIIVFLPYDYFVRPEAGFLSLNPLRMLLRILKNGLGCLPIVAGILMLFLPGQGILCLLLGVSFLNFPGKRHLEMRLLRLKRVRSSVAWIRRKAKRRPLQLPEEIA